VRELFAFKRGTEGVPVVFLHGFGLSHSCWADVIGQIAPGRNLLAFDLPGHAGSLGMPHGSAAVAAKAVLADLAARKIERAHLVGHSMGGAVAAIAALRDPKQVASLTLLAPGGFGRAIAGAVLRRYGVATDEGELAKLMPHFFSAMHPPPAGLAASIASEHRAPGATQALATIVETFFDGAEQKLLPLNALAQLAIPTRVFWGSADRILPAPSPDALPASLRPNILEGAGHMLPNEVPDEIARVVAENCR
jgi:pyruvate dehydrogenase E2 component (dihydrolipoamide acetyltransferase)